MRIAFVTFEYPPLIFGGAGVYAIHIIRELARRGHQVLIFTPVNRDQISNNQKKEENIVVIQVPVHPKIPFKALQFWLRLPKIVKQIENEGKFDIIHFNGISYGFFKRKIADAPHILTIHHLITDAITNNNEKLLSRLMNFSGETGFFLYFIEKRCIKSVDQIIAVSKFTRDQIIQTYNINRSKVDVVYNGLDDTGYRFSQKELDEIRSRYHLKNTPILLFVGRVDDPRKGLDLLIRSFKLVLQDVDAQLLIVGRGMLNKNWNLFEPISEKIYFVGYIDEVSLKKCYALCNMYVCPSKMEGFGFTIVEAFAAGKPVVATKVGAIPELIEHGKNGILIENNDVSGLADAIIRYLKNPVLSEKTGEINLKYIELNFKWATNINQIEKIYEELKYS